MARDPMKRTMVKRVRRRMWGGTFDMRIYDDGAARIRVDHPSNDPEVEMAMAGRVVRVAREAFAKYGLDARVGPITWHDDPPR